MSATVQTLSLEASPVSTTSRPASVDDLETASDARRGGVSPWLVVLLGLLGALMVATRPLLQPEGRPQLPPLSLLSQTSGLLAGYGALVVLLLVARQPALERGVGAHVLARWHSRLAPLFLLLVLVHAGAAVAASAWLGRRRVGATLLDAVVRVLTVPWVPAATVATILLVVVAVTSIRAARRTLGHERWQGIHLLTYVAVALGFGHQLTGPDLVGHVALQVAWALAYAYVFAALLHHRLLTPVRQSAAHRLQVTDVRREGTDVVSITVGGKDLDDLDAQPGQFFRWRFITPDHWRSAHPFSLSAAPTSDALRLTVKAVGDGTRTLQDLAVGTWVVAEGPYGVMTPERRSRPGVLLIAGGAGITPLRALLESLPVVDGEDVALLYRARGADHLVFVDELEAIAARRGARILYVLGEDPELLATPALLGLVPDVADRDVFLCGPPPMAAAVRGALREAGLPRGHLHEERFSL